MIHSRRIRTKVMARVINNNRIRNINCWYQISILQKGRLTGVLKQLKCLLRMANLKIQNLQAKMLVVQAPTEVKIEAMVSVQEANQADFLKYLTKKCPSLSSTKPI